MRGRPIWQKVYLAAHPVGPWLCEFCGDSVSGFTREDDGVVHHKDEDRKNNELSNLAAMHARCHILYHRPMDHSDRGRKISEAKKGVPSKLKGRKLSPRDPSVHQKAWETRRARAQAESRESGVSEHRMRPVQSAAPVVQR